MKAVLIAHQVLAPRTHDLLSLSRSIESLDRSWSWDDVELASLNRAAVNYRYPGESADRDDAAEALSICERAGRVAEVDRRGRTNRSILKSGGSTSASRT